MTLAALEVIVHAVPPPPLLPCPVLLLDCVSRLGCIWSPKVLILMERKGCPDGEVEVSLGGINP